MAFRITATDLRSDGPEVESFDNKLIKLTISTREALESGPSLAHPRPPDKKGIPRILLGLSVENLRQQGLAMRNLPRPLPRYEVGNCAIFENALAVFPGWPAAVCSLSRLLDDLGCLCRNDG